MDRTQSTGKKIYKAPVLIEYGSIVKLTQTGPSVGADARAKQASPCL